MGIVSKLKDKIKKLNLMLDKKIQVRVVIALDNKNRHHFLPVLSKRTIDELQLTLHLKQNGNPEYAEFIINYNENPELESQI